MHFISQFGNFASDLSERIRSAARILRWALARYGSKKQRLDLSEISHAFQTPLNVALGHLYTLKQKRGSEPEIKQIEKIINEISLKTYSFINLSSIEYCVAQFHFQKTDLTKLVEEIAEEFAVVCQSQNIQFGFKSQGQVYVRCDQKQLTEAISNILSNSVKYISNERQISLELSVAERVAIEVSDSGVGIPPESLVKIFQKFYRVNNQNKIRGSGLGLSIAKTIIKLHGGQIKVISELGKGSKFTIILPKIK